MIYSYLRNFQSSNNLKNFTNRNYYKHILACNYIFYIDMTSVVEKVVKPIHR
jgi:hypothetical protein